MTAQNYLTVSVNVICCCVALLTVSRCFAQQSPDSQRKSIVLRTLQQILSTGNNSLLSAQETDAILPVGEAFNLFQSYGLLAFNVNVAPLILVSSPNSRAIGNGSPAQPFTLPLFQMTTHPVLDQKLYTPEIRRPHMNVARSNFCFIEKKKVKFRPFNRPADEEMLRVLVRANVIHSTLQFSASFQEGTNSWWRWWIVPFDSTCVGIPKLWWSDFCPDSPLTDCRNPGGHLQPVSTVFPARKIFKSFYSNDIFYWRHLRQTKPQPGRSTSFPEFTAFQPLT